MPGFIPTGFISLDDAVDRVCRERRGEPRALPAIDAPAKSRFPVQRAERPPAWRDAFRAAAGTLARIQRGESDPRGDAEGALLRAFAEPALPAYLQPDDGGEPVPVPVAVWRRDDGAEAFRTSRAEWIVSAVMLDGPAGSRVPYPIMQRGRVILAASDLDEWLRRTAARAAALHTSGGEARLRAHLVKMMRAEPNVPRSKAKVRAELPADIAGHVSSRGFERAWGEAVLASGAAAWGQGGRRPAAHANNENPNT